MRDLAAAADFYTARLGLGLLARDGDRAIFGVGGRELLRLREDPRAPRAPGTAGLYHFALRVPSRAALGRSLRQLIDRGTRLTGAADHGVSEALYLSDPEGNGIEIYRDRPAAEWPRIGGRLGMFTEALDADGVLAASLAGGPHDGMLEAGTVVGHVHLHVSQLEPARRFYLDVIGFDLMQELGRLAVFVSAGGYHHHVACNTWLGEGAPPPADGAAGLDHFEITLPDRGALEALAGRARSAGIVPVEAAGGLVLRDPSAHRVLVTAP